MHLFYSQHLKCLLVLLKTMAGQWSGCPIRESLLLGAKSEFEMAKFVRKIGLVLARFEDLQTRLSNYTTAFKILFGLLEVGKFFANLI